MAYTFDDFQRELIGVVDYDKLSLLAAWAAVFEKNGCTICHSKANTHAAFAICIECAKDIVKKMTVFDEAQIKALRAAHAKFPKRKRP